jgi:hypothetical protein
MGILASEQICNQASITQAFFIPEWQSLALLALISSAGLLAIAYMLNRLLNNEEGQVITKLEIFELFTTAFIILVSIGLVQSACEIPISGIFFQDYMEPDDNLFDAAAAVLQSFSEDLALSMATLHAIFIPIDFQTTTTLTMQPMGLGTVVQPTSGIGAIVKPALVNAMQAIALAYIVIRAEMFVLDFTSYAFITFYFPLGIILRSFAPTRKIGGALIGLVLGLVLVFPFLIVLNGVVAFSISPTVFQFQEGDWTTLKDFTQGSFTNIFGGLSGISDLANPFNFFYAINQLIGGVFGGIIGFVIFFFMRSAGAAVLIGLFFPALNTLLLVTTVRYITKSLGEEIDVTNLTRLI